MDIIKRNKQDLYSQVYRVFGQHRNSLLHALVGEVVYIAQELEHLLKEKIKKTAEPNGEGSIFDKKSIKNLIEMLKLPEPVAVKLKNVADLRNWVIHSAYLEKYCMPIKQDGSTTDLDELVISIIRKYELLSKDDIDRLVEHLKQPRQVKHDIFAIGLTFPGIRFAHNKDVNAYYLSSHRDWVLLKIVITYCLIYEFHDFLNDNPLSLYIQEETVILKYVEEFLDGKIMQSSAAECIAMYTNYEQACAEGMIMATKNMITGDTIMRVVNESILETIAKFLLESGKATLSNIATALEKYMDYEPNKKKEFRKYKVTNC